VSILNLSIGHLREEMLVSATCLHHGLLLHLHLMKSFATEQRNARPPWLTCTELSHKTTKHEHSRIIARQHHRHNAPIDCSENLISLPPTPSPQFLFFTQTQQKSQKEGSLWRRNKQGADRNQKIGAGARDYLLERNLAIWRLRHDEIRPVGRSFEASLRCVEAL
jgi:hypothetical protein